LKRAPGTDELWLPLIGPLWVWMVVSHLIVLFLPVAVLALPISIRGETFRLLGLAVVAATLTLSVLMAYFLSRSLRSLSRTSNQIADGRLGATADLVRANQSHVSEVRELSADVVSMAEQLQKRMAYATEFASNVSHEFKTPITTLRGTVELLMLDADMPTEQRQRFLCNALEDLDRMERLLTGLMALARAEQRAERGAVCMDALLATMMERHPEVVVSGASGWVWGDAAQLEAAVENVVDNALRHGGATVSVRVVAWHEGDAVGLDVMDDGPGISPANLPQIFERFFTTSAERKGTGLGLALVHTIVSRHQGTVEAQSRPGATRLRIRLPALPDPTAPSAGGEWAGATRGRS
jgi:signal transduction histidine kinase